jgi:hypothetical protein
MCRGAAKLVAHEAHRPTIRKAALLPFDIKFDLRSLTARRLNIELVQIVERSNSTRPSKFAHALLDPGLQRTPSRNDHSNADRTVGVEPIEILQIPIEEWVFVIPFDFESDRSLVEGPELPPSR